ncbi:MAG: FmdB family zinc ribbon protein [Bacillota bacterium]
MPTYDFRCGSCGSRFSVFTAINRKNDVKCSTCGSSNVAQVFSGLNFLSKGRSSNSGSGKKSCPGHSCSSCSGC